jgi:4,5-dihydroxyphthalate decarboxylase
MNFALLSRPRTQALLDGRLKPADLALDWRATPDPLGRGLPEHERHRDLRSGQIDGGEMSISSFVQAKAQGAPLVALPIFLKRGLVQRSLFCAVDSPLLSPEQLVGGRVGLVSYTSSMATWMRGVLADEYGLSPASARWFTLGSPHHGGQVVAIPDGFSAARVRAWEELDGYCHELDRRESFLFSLLERNELDTVISFQARVAGGKFRPLLREEEEFWRHYRRSGVYPINHLFVIREEILKENPAHAATLLLLLRESRSLWTDYLPQEERAAIESEIEHLGWDPFAYRLGDVEKTSLQTFAEYLYREQMIFHKLAADELFIL